MMARRSIGAVTRLALAALILAAVATPITLAAASVPKADKRSAKKTLKQIAALKTTTAALLAEVTALQTKAVELESSEPPVKSLPTGPAGGDLSGIYPNPKIRAGAITSASVLNGSLQTSDFTAGSVDRSKLFGSAIGFPDLAPRAIGNAELLPSTVGAQQLFGTHSVIGKPEFIGAGQVRGVSAPCPPGETLLGGGMEWELSQVIPPPPTPTGLTITASHPRQEMPGEPNPNVWEGVGKNGSGSLQTLFAIAICLGAG
jgi:hypothetical protein